jgi:hypothetical protein
MHLRITGVVQIGQTTGQMQNQFARLIGRHYAATESIPQTALGDLRD